PAAGAVEGGGAAGAGAGGGCVSVVPCARTGVVQAMARGSVIRRYMVGCLPSPLSCHALRTRPPAPTPPRAAPRKGRRAGRPRQRGEVRGGRGKPQAGGERGAEGGARTALGPGGDPGSGAGRAVCQLQSGVAPPISRLRRGPPGPGSASAPLRGRPAGSSR